MTFEYCYASSFFFFHVFTMPIALNTSSWNKLGRNDFAEVIEVTKRVEKPVIPYSLVE